MTREPYRGTSRKLLLSFDVGTTFSGVSYSIMDPGHVPEIHPVTRFPGQEQSGGDGKIPSILYYDRYGPKVVGAEAIREGIEDTAEQQGWQKAEWFKLHLRPTVGSMSLLDGSKIPPLPFTHTVVKVFADYIKYLYDCSTSYIRNAHPTLLWQSVEQTIEFVLTHPNGWEGPQQNQMRQAAVKAGLITDNEMGHARISFVTEGEASLHYCIDKGWSTQAIQRGEGIVIVDAGGGTVDISSYRGQGGKYEEIAAAQCALQGAAIVTNRAKAYFEKLLRGSYFANKIRRITDIFDTRTKLTFRNSTDPLRIGFGSPRDNDPMRGISVGQLRLAGTEVASFFQPSVQSIVEGVKEQRNKSQYTIKTVLLVGGFAASDWLYAQITSSLHPFGIEVFRPGGDTGKPVAYGGASYYLDRRVKSRTSKAAYGINVFGRYDPGKTTHLTRRHQLERHPVEGYLGFDNMFSTILDKDISVSETQEFRASFTRSYHSLAGIGNATSVNIMRYRGLPASDLWIGTEANTWDTLCSVEFDASRLPTSSARPEGGFTLIYRVSFDVIIRFGLTELQAQVAWKEPGGAESRTKAKIVYG